MICAGEAVSQRLQGAAAVDGGVSGGFVYGDGAGSELMHGGVSQRYNAALSHKIEAGASNRSAAISHRLEAITTIRGDEGASNRSYRASIQMGDAPIGTIQAGGSTWDLPGESHGHYAGEIETISQDGIGTVRAMIEII